MQFVDELLWQFIRNRPGRNAVGIQKSVFSSGNVAESGGNVNILLPLPAQGFCRMFDWADCNLSSTATLIRLLFSGPIGIGTAVRVVYWAGAFNAEVYPLIGGMSL